MLTTWSGVILMAGPLQEGQGDLKDTIAPGSPGKEPRTRPSLRSAGAALATKALAPLPAPPPPAPPPPPPLPPPHETARTSPMADNPFAQPSTLPFQMPPFDRIHDSDYLPAFEAGMREQLREVAAIAHNPHPATFENTIVALERSGQLLTRVRDGLLESQCLQHRSADGEDRHRDGAQAHRAGRRDSPERGAVGAHRAAVPASAPALHLDPESLAAADALSHDLRARRCASAAAAAGATAGAEQADLLPHHPLQAERAQGHRRRRRGGRQRGRARRTVGRADRRGGRRPRRRAACRASGSSRCRTPPTSRCWRS